MTKYVLDLYWMDTIVHQTWLLPVWETQLTCSGWFTNLARQIDVRHPLSRTLHDRSVFGPSHRTACSDAPHPNASGHSEKKKNARSISASHTSVPQGPLRKGSKPALEAAGGARWNSERDVRARRAVTPRPRCVAQPFR